MKYICLLPAVAALLLAGPAARAQSLGYPINLARTQAGTYADLGATSTVIATANADDANSAPQDIGFPFVFDGTTYTQFVLNTNGFIKLGAVAPPSPAAFQPYAQLGAGGPLDNAALTDLILPFNTDLTSSAAAPAEYRVLTTGTAPNRVCTVQWKNVADKARPATNTNAALVPAQLASFSFQLQIYEADRHIAFVYGPATASSAANAYVSTTAGLKGAGNAANVGQLALAFKSSTTDWSGTLFGDEPYTSNFGHNLRNNVLPDAGRTYVFNAPAPNDAAVAEIHALGTALAPGVPLTVEVVVRNVGATSFAGAPLTLAVSGANAVTLPAQPTGALAVGDFVTLTFRNISLPVPGTNTLTASLPADGNNANNVRTQPLFTSSTAISYAVSGLPVPFGYGGFPAGETWAPAARFSLAGPRTVTSVQAQLYDAATTATQASSVGQTVYGVVLNAATGAVLARSADYVIKSSDFGAAHSFVLATPLTLPAGDFLAGLAQVRAAGSLPYYPLAQQAETPTRPDTFYEVNLTGAASTPVPVRSDCNMLGVTTSPVLAAASAAGPLVLAAYPNPSASGDFTLEPGPAAAGAASLLVEVTDLLGRRVYRGAARPNTPTTLSLAGEAPGLYTLRVSNGAQTTQQQLSIAP